MFYKVIRNNSTVDVIDNDAFALYRIDKESLQETTVIDGSNCSACIINLAASPALPMYVLYRVAFYIQKYYSYLHIDWFTTFYHVEKTNYLQTAFEMKELLEGNCFYNEGHDRLHRFADFEEQEQIEDVDTIILKIVMMNIIGFNVIIK